MTVLLIGCGRMGSAMARGWRDTDRVLAFDPVAALPDVVEQVEDLSVLTVDGPLVVVLAVKPQAFTAMAAMLAPLAGHAPLVLSIMAGIPLRAISDAFGGSSRVTRAMPNTPAAVGKGVTGAVAAAGVCATDRARIGALLAVLGDVVWLDREADLDLVTAVSGSGPAYFFRMTEALAGAAIEAGLSAEVAMRLARATLTGAAALAEADPSSLADLRTQVTSPGGTTAAGLAQMDRANGVDALMEDVVAAAAGRSRELAG